MPLRFARTPDESERDELQRMTHLERSLEALREACRGFFAGLSKQDVLRMTGLAS